MSYDTHDIRWHDDNKEIILVTFGREITYPTLYEIYEECARMLDTVSHPVILVHDLTQLELVIKIDIAAMAKLPRMRIIRHPRWHASCFANPNGRSQIILDVASRLLPHIMRKTYVKATVEEALVAAEANLAEMRSN